MKNNSRREAMRSTRAAAQDGTLGEGTGTNLERNSDLPGGEERISKCGIVKHKAAGGREQAECPPTHLKLAIRCTHSAT